MKSAPASSASQLAGLQDHLEVRRPARRLDRDDLLVDLKVASGQERAPVDDHVDLVGAEWLRPDRFRFGASTLLNDLLMQRSRMATGRYAGPDYVTLD